MQRSIKPERESLQTDNLTFVKTESGKLPIINQVGNACISSYNRLHGQKNSLTDLHPAQPLYRILTHYSVRVALVSTLISSGDTHTIRRHTTNDEKNARYITIYGAIDDTDLGLLHRTEQ